MDSNHRPYYSPTEMYLRLRGRTCTFKADLSVASVKPTVATRTLRFLFSPLVDSNTLLLNYNTSRKKRPWGYAQATKNHRYCHVPSRLWETTLVISCCSRCFLILSLFETGLHSKYRLWLDGFTAKIFQVKGSKILVDCREVWAEIFFLCFLIGVFDRDFEFHASN